MKLSGIRYNYSRETNNEGHAKPDSAVAVPFDQRGAKVSVALHLRLLGARADNKPQ